VCGTDDWIEFLFALLDSRGRVLPFVGREALVANKRATGRRKDRGDLEALGEPD
jgi:hypothetical protein